MLRRHVAKLIAELELFTQYTALSPRSKKTLASREDVERRAAFLGDVLIGRCYAAFGGLVADNQYAALGLMLVGCLARVGRVVGGLRGEVKVSERVEGGSLEGEGKDQDLGEVVSREEAASEEATKVQNTEEGEDNVALKRSKPEKRSVMADETKNSAGEDSTATKCPKKKRKKGDAFDDLFSGLI